MIELNKILIKSNSVKPSTATAISVIHCCGAFLIMEQFLKDHLKTISEFDENCTSWQYSEDVNTDALTDDWLENRTSYIYKVAVLCAIDANKCDWVHVAIGTQRSKNSEMEVKGVFNFNEGENDDMGRVIDRAFKLMQYTHPAFEVD